MVMIIAYLYFAGACMTGGMLLMEAEAYEMEYHVWKAIVFILAWPISPIYIVIFIALHFVEKRIHNE